MIEKLDNLFSEISELQNERRKEKIQWERDGKGINSDNISMLDRFIESKKKSVLRLRDELLSKGVVIPEKYNFTYFMIFEK